MSNINPIKVIMLGASLEQNGGIATVEKLILQYIHPEVKIHHITSHDEGSILHRLIVFAKALSVLVAKLISEPVDLVHIHISDGGSLLRKAILAMIAFIFNKPILMHAHGAEFHVTYAKLPSFAQKALSLIFQRCQRFIVLSKTWQDYYINNLKLYEKRVVILPNPTEIPDQIPNRENRTKVNLVFCGRIGQRKGAFDLIQAFANLPEQCKYSAQLILAGDGEIDEGQQLVANLNLTNQVNFLGWINSKQRDELLSQADVFILPSYNEGLPMAILEAMGWGLPIIATPVGGIPELVISHKNGLLVNQGNIQELSHAIQLLIQNEDLRLHLGSVARNSVEQFDVKNYCTHLADLYYSIA